MTDEEIQEILENGRNAGLTGGEDISYRAVFNALSKAPEIKISPSFADRLVDKILARQKRESRRDLIWLSVGVVFLVAGRVSTAAGAGLRFPLGFLKEISGLAGVFVFGTAIIVAFNWLEKKAISKSVKF